MANVIVQATDVYFFHYATAYYSVAGNSVPYIAPSLAQQITIRYNRLLGTGL